MVYKTKKKKKVQEKKRQKKRQKKDILYFDFLINFGQKVLLKVLSEELKLRRINEFCIPFVLFESF